METSNGKIPFPGGYEAASITGRQYKFTRINSGIREEFAAWAMSQAYERLEKLRPRLPKADYFRRLKSLDDDVNSGAYDWGFPLDPNGCGSAVFQVRFQGEGPARLALMLLREHHPTITLQEVNQAFRDEEEAATKENRVNRFQDALMRALDPNSASPSAVAGETLTMQTPGAETSA